MGMDRTPSAFGLWVREQRRVLKLSRSELAVYAGVAESSVRNLETGRHGTSPRTRALVETALLQLNPGRPTQDLSPLLLHARLIGLRRRGTLVLGVELKPQLVRRLVSYLLQPREKGALGKEKSVVLISIHLPGTTLSQG
jgi:transcriptional regulator with XRE-family HTH domain